MVDGCVLLVFLDAFKFLNDAEHILVGRSFSSDWKTLLPSVRSIYIWWSCVDCTHTQRHTVCARCVDDKFTRSGLVVMSETSRSRE